MKNNKLNLTICTIVLPFLANCPEIDPLGDNVQLVDATTQAPLSQSDPEPSPAAKQIIDAYNLEKQSFRNQITVYYHYESKNGANLNEHLLLRLVIINIHGQQYEFKSYQEDIDKTNGETREVETTLRTYLNGLVRFLLAGLAEIRDDTTLNESKLSQLISVPKYNKTQKWKCIFSAHQDTTSSASTGPAHPESTTDWPALQSEKGKSRTQNPKVSVWQPKSLGLGKYQ